jgi:hypothetical protein
MSRRMFSSKTQAGKLAYAVTFVSMLPFPAMAGMGGIGVAAVNEGQFTVTWRSSVSSDGQNAALHGRFRNRFMFDYGLTDRFALALYMQIDNPGNGTHEHDAMIGEARFELTDAPASGYFSGFRLRYTGKDGDKNPPMPIYE